MTTRLINKKMDNTTISIVSLVMIALGISNGIVFTTLFDYCDNRKLRDLLGQALDNKFELEKKIDKLKQELKDERDEKNNILQKLNMILKQHMFLPAPEGPIERSRACSDSDTEDEFDCPTSPDAK